MGSRYRLKQGMLLAAGKNSSDCNKKYYSRSYIEEIDFQSFVNSTHQFIEIYNAERQHMFKLYFSPIDSNSINIDFKSNKYVTSNKQTLGVFVTLLGVATFAATVASEAPFYLIFWYNPRNSTVMNVSLSRNIDPSVKNYIRAVSTRHQFQNLEKQKEKQPKAYFTFLGQMMKEIEKYAK